MHRALRILEIISFVLQHASDSTRVKCARVCKLWSEVALDLIWDQVGVPTDNLFAILRPDLLPLRLTNEEMLKGVDVCVFALYRSMAAPNVWLTHPLLICHYSGSARKASTTLPKRIGTGSSTTLGALKNSLTSTLLPVIGTRCLLSPNIVSIQVPSHVCGDCT